jgi:hypothetical protein
MKRYISLAGALLLGTVVAKEKTHTFKKHLIKHETKVATHTGNNTHHRNETKRHHDDSPDSRYSRDSSEHHHHHNKTQKV